VTALLLRLWPALAVLGVLGIAAAGAAWITDALNDRAALAREVQEQADTLAAYQLALAETQANEAAVVNALSRAHARLAAITADRAATLEDLRHATAPDCPVPDAVRDAVNRLWDDADAD